MKISNGVNKCFFSNSVSQTKKIGVALAKEILGRKSKKAIILGLTGELGGGKTTFLQGFARGLGIKQRVLSPTFIIFRRFKIKDLRFKNFYHVDCYRINKAKEILRLGFKEIAANPQNIVAVEWADRIKKILPKETIWIKFKFIDKTTRNLLIKCTG